MKNIIMGSKFAGLLAASFLYAVNSYAAVQSHDLPDWVVDQSNYEKCAVGVAGSESANHADAAMYAGALELGMMQLVKVDGIEKSYSEKSVIKNVKQLNRVTRLLAETSGEKIREVQNWKSSAGDYFALVCINDEGKTLKPVAGILKSYFETNELNMSAKINQSLLLNINNKTSFDAVDEFSYVGNKSRWLERVNNEAASIEANENGEAQDEFVNVAVADVRVREGKVAQAYLQLLAQSRHVLASKLKSKVRKALQQDSAADDGKTIFSEVIKNTLVEKVYYDKIEGSIYMIMTHRYTTQDIEKTVERNLKADKHQARVQ